MSNHYDTLGVDKNSSLIEIKQAYREKAFLLHPDKNMERNTTPEFQNMQVAYNTLSNPHQRKLYDLQMSQKKIAPYPIFEPEMSRTGPENLCRGLVKGGSGILLGGLVIVLCGTGGFLVGTSGFLFLNLLSSSIGLIPTLFLSPPIFNIFLYSGFQIACTGSFLGAKIMWDGACHSASAISYGCSQAIETIFTNSENIEEECEKIKIDNQEFVLM